MTKILTGKKNFYISLDKIPYFLLTSIFKLVISNGKKLIIGIINKKTNGPIIKKQARGQYRVKDYKALAEVLAKLGASRLSSNLNQLAKAANSGSLPVTPETENALQAACRDIRAVKRLLMTALGIQER